MMCYKHSEHWAVNPRITGSLQQRLCRRCFENSLGVFTRFANMSGKNRDVMFVIAVKLLHEYNYSYVRVFNKITDLCPLIVSLRIYFTDWTINISGLLSADKCCSSQQQLKVVISGRGAMLSLFIFNSKRWKIASKPIGPGFDSRGKHVSGIQFGQKISIPV